MIVLGTSAWAPTQRLGMQLKQAIKASGRSVRLVLPKDRSSALTAAQLKFNHLDDGNPEIIALSGKNRIIIARTLAYQDIDAYSARDFERPGRSAKVGMLPPKLAQILINLAGPKTGRILDPFCGSGVILQEARLMGHAVIGRDNNQTMIQAAKANMEWLDRQQSGLPAWSIELADARSTKLPDQVSAIVTESYLGPAFSHAPSTIQLKQADQQVTDLIRSFLKQIKGFSGPIVICVPAWQTKAGEQLPQIVDEIPRLGYTFGQSAHVSPDQLVYKRPGQIVGRRILILKRAS